MKRSMSPSSTPVLTLFLIFVFSVSTFIDFGLCYGRINGGGCRQSEREALLKIKKDLKDPSGRLASWSVSSGDCCSWYGVICDNSTGHVLELHLHTPFYAEPVSSSGEFDEATPLLGERYRKYSVYSEISTEAIVTSDLFGGKISPFLLNLTHLGYLDLSNNEFEGIQIPKFFGSMVTLTYLNLFHAGFQGEIPPQLGNLTNLRYLNLRSSYYSSQSLVWLSTLSSLQFLDFSRADLSEASNWMEVITTLPSLQRLYLSSCFLPPVPPVHNVNVSSLSVLDLSNSLYHFSHFSWVSRFKDLKSLSLASNLIGGSPPREIQNLTSLRELDLSGNFFNASVPNWLFDLRHLEILNLAGNDFSNCQVSHVPPSVLNVNVSSLSVLDLSGSLYHFSHFSWVSRFKDLKSLSLAHNFIEGSPPREIQNLTSLRELDLSGNSFNASLPNWLFDLRHLEILNLAENDFSNCQVSHVPPSVHNVNVSSLSVLDLSSSLHHFSHFSWVSRFKDLKSLSLAYNFIEGSLPREIQNLTSLRELDLSGNSFNASVPNWLFDLRHLEILNLAENDFSNCQVSHVPPSVHNVTFSSLSTLDLSGNQFDDSVFPNCIFGLKSLSSLYLQYNNLQGLLTIDFKNMTSLTELYLNDNDFGSSIPMWLHGFTNLQVLDLADNNLHGKLSNSIGNMTSLVSLDLSGNYELVGGIPASFKKLCNLRSLSLSNTKLSQEVNKVFESLLGCGSKVLELLNLRNCSLFGDWVTKDLGQFKSLASLDLGNNSISGAIPMSLVELNSLTFLDLSSNKMDGNLPINIGKLRKLEEFYMGHNFISGPIPMSFGELSSLKSLYLLNNKLNGTLPVNFGMLSNLEWADISHNSMEGDVSEIHFKNLSKLEVFLASGNKLKLRVGPSWIPPICLTDLELGSWDVGPQFPTWIPLLENLQSLNLSNSGISSSIPVWFSESSQFQSLDLSNNRITGLLPNISSQLYTIDLSNNLLFGTISNFLCHKTSNQVMEALNLEKNLLFGELPDCWKRWPWLTSVKLSSNKFNGSISKSIGTLSILNYLHLRNNSLSGELPLSLKHCEKLVTLDLGENELVGSIPRWIGKSFSSLVVLNFRTNKFDGVIPEEICQASSLQILDFANNNLFGLIPGCFSNFSEMVSVNDLRKILPILSSFNNSTIDSMLLQLKGEMLEYSTILGLVRIVDLSNNRLSGEIPQEMTRLAGLMSLNLSHNLLGGRIPKDIGGMSSIEIIDLSNNRLIGEIPSSISNLTFLSHLNLSYNKLVRRIPSSAQIQGFDSSSFIGNELCGKPLTDNCSSEGTVIIPNSKENGKESGRHGFEIEWFYVTLAFGFIVGFWGVVGPLLFSRNWRKTYFQFLQRVEDKIYIWWHFK